MNNPFESIEARLRNIESLVLDLKHLPRITPTEPKEEFLSIEEAAKFLKLQVSTVRTKINRNELPYMKPENSKGVIFSSLELAEYLKAGRKKTNAEIEAEADAYLNKKRGAK